MKRRTILTAPAALAAIPVVAATVRASSDKPQHLRAYLYADDIRRLKRREPETVERVLKTVDGISAWKKVEFVAGPGPHDHGFKEDVVQVVPEPTSIPEARRALIQAFKDDPGFRDVYVANIACCLMDEEASSPNLYYQTFQDYDTRMAYAERIMGHLFNHRELDEPSG